MRTRRSTRPADDPRTGLDDLAGRNRDAAEELVDGRPDRAVAALESLLDDCRRRVGDQHPETLVVEGNLAVAYVMTGAQEQGVRLMLANLAGRERVFGDEHVATLSARDAVATTHRLAGRLVEALVLHSRVAAQRNRVLGPSHPDTLTTRLGLGLTFAAAGDTAMAVDVLMAVLQDCGGSGVESRHAEVLRSCLTDLNRPGAVAGPPGVATVPRQRSTGAPAAPDPVASPHGLGGRPTIEIGSGV